MHRIIYRFIGISPFRTNTDGAYTHTCYDKYHLYFITDLDIELLHYRLFISFKRLEV